MIICDSREKKNEKILKYFADHNIPYEVKKLDTGDYMSIDNDRVTIDRKKDLSELTRNLFSDDKSRFWREMRRAKEERLKMIILCEHGGGIKSIQDVCRYKNPYSRVSGKALMEEIYRVHMAYGVEFLFCSKRSTGRRIAELLGVRT